MSHLLTTREEAWFIILLDSVCLSVCIICLSDDNFQSLDVGSLIFAHPVDPKNMAH